MTVSSFKRSIVFLFLLFLSAPQMAIGQNKKEACICGHLKLDETWDSTIYLSHIPTFADMYGMSNEMIIAKTIIDSLGNFAFDISFLPEVDNLFRVHITKKGDSPTSMIIGGKDENHLFLLANRHSVIQMESSSFYPPFKKMNFRRSKENKAFQHISDLVFTADSTASESGRAKRQFIERKTEEELLTIAESSSIPLVSLYAIYQNEFESNNVTNSDFYKTYLDKWKNNTSPYFKTFRKQLPIKADKKSNIIPWAILLACIFIVVGFIIGKYGIKKKKGISNLSVQKRKVFKLLQEGATNQEISEQYNIGISTVKSHVSRIFTKMNVKSRKDIMNIK